jgi:glycosyltransferase involved in cell wall biosynthesis
VTNHNLNTAERAGPLFSIVIPYYRKTDTISRAIDSCLTQTFTDFEIVIVDDCSKDNIKALLTRYESYAIRLYVNKENQGVSTTRNVGIEHSRGEYIAFLDADDEFCRDKLEVCREHLAPHRILCSQTSLDRGVGRNVVRPKIVCTPGQRIARYVFVQNQPIQTSTIVVPARLAKDNLFRPFLNRLEENELVLRLVSEGYELRMLPAALSIWHDETTENRLSHSSWEANAVPAIDYLYEQGLINRCEYLNYCVGRLVPRLLFKQPRKMMAYLGEALASGSVSWIRLPAVILRALLPYSCYRCLVNLHTRLTGEEQTS